MSLTLLVVSWSCTGERPVIVEPSPDGGHVSDAGSASDGGVTDAGPLDGGGSSDAGAMDGGAVDAGCVAPRMECGADCSNLQTDPAHCGSCENRCGDGQLCFQGICGTSVCGTCAANEYCDAATRTCRTGCDSDSQCPQPGTCTQHVCTCATGHHLCNGACASDTSTGSCGASCSACPDPWGGSATCDGNACGVSCDFGYHRCGLDCFDNTQPSSCGQNCFACSSPSHGYATCNAGQCGIACSSGYAACGSSCVAESPSQCGANCQSCPPPGVAHATADCVSGTCSYRCTWPYVKTATGCDLAVAVYTGYYRACAKTQSGAIPCWGGSGGSLPTGATSISLGSTSCYVMSGQLWCGGSQVSIAGTTVSQVSVGDGHICAVTSDHRLYCWGSNTFGELGDNTTTYRSAPTQIYPANSVIRVAAGGSHTCAILTNGTVACWGYNYYGQVGNNDRGNIGTDVHSPAAVPNLTSVTDIAAGDYHTCAIAGGALYCWGWNEHGQLAHTPDACLPSAYHDHCPAPVQVFSSGVTVVAAGSSNTCAVKDGAGYCWGYNANGEVGNGSHGGQYGVYTPYLVLSDAIGIATNVAGYFACAVQSSGGVLCWGENSSGQLGDGTHTEQDSPVECTGR